MAPATSKCFRLLDLPPELRARIYEYAFADESPEEVDLIQIESHLPWPALTAVSRLVRQESVPCFQDAFEKFWRGHVPCTGFFGAHVDLEESEQDRKRFSSKICARLERLPTFEGITAITIRDGLLVRKDAADVGGIIIFKRSESAAVTVKMVWPVTRALQNLLELAIRWTSCCRLGSRIARRHTGITSAMTKNHA